MKKVFEKVFHVIFRTKTLPVWKSSNIVGTDGGGGGGMGLCFKVLLIVNITQSVT